jgi:uncharacterized membrane protein
MGMKARTAGVLCYLFAWVGGLVGFVGWIVLMVAAHRGRYYKLPLFGDYTEQLANRGRF